MKSLLLNVKKKHYLLLLILTNRTKHKTGPTLKRANFFFQLYVDEVKALTFSNTQNISQMVGKTLRSHPFFISLHE